MADRFLLKQFAGQADNNGVFGSAQQGQGQVVSDLKQVQSLNSFENGWDSATVTGDKLPCLEEFQGVSALAYKAIKELYSEGIPQWLSTETYYMDSFVVYNHKLFKNITGSYTTNNPELDTTNWEEYSAGKGDNETSVINLDKEIEVIGSYNKNTAEGATRVKYDWIGTKEEWEEQQIETLHPDWICYITNDIEISDNDLVTLAGNQTITGNKQVPTQPVSDNSQKIANTAFVKNCFQLVNELPENPVEGVLYLIPEENS